MSSPLESSGVTEGRSRFSRIWSNVGTLLGRRPIGARGRGFARPDGSRALRRTDDTENRMTEFGWSAENMGSVYLGAPMDAPKPRGRWLLISHLFFVIVPSVVVAIYLTFVASPQYQVETKLTVRSASSTNSISASSSLLRKIGLNSTSSNGQDAVIVADYVKSRAIIADIGGREALAKWFGKPSIDYFSRLDTTDSEEKAFRYWGNHVIAQVDGISGIVTIRVLGFTPSDTLELTDTIVKRSEDLLNKLSLRSRSDYLDRAGAEVEESAGTLATVRSKMVEFQERTRSLDPTETAKQILEIITKLTLQYLDIEKELALSKSMNVVRPGEQRLKANAQVLNEQIKKYEGMLAGSGDATLSAQLKEFELLKLHLEFAEKLYTVSRAAYEEARRNLERQQLYLAVVVQPTAPDRPTYPTPFTSVLLLFAWLTIGWGIVCLVFAAVRDGFSD